MSRSRQFEEFFHANGASLLRTAVLLSGGDRHAGEDLLQDAMERCLRSWPTAKVEFPAAYVRTTMAARPTPSSPPHRARPRVVVPPE